jgi:integrase/recombinase XerD
MHFIEHRVLSALEQVNRVLAIPNLKTDLRLVDHLTAEQCRAILENPAPHTRLGIRDRAMLHVSVTAGLRVSELVGLHLGDVSFESRYLNLHVCGKGRKNRLLTLWKAVAESVRAWLAVRGEAMVPELFLNARGNALTRAGFEYLLRKHATEASQYCATSVSRLTYYATLVRSISCRQRVTSARSPCGWVTRASRPRRITCVLM